MSRLHDHPQTHHIPYDSSGLVNSSSQRPLPANTQHVQQTDIHTPVGFEPTIRQAAADPHLRLGPVVTVYTRCFNVQSFFFLRTRFQRIYVSLNKSVASKEHGSVQCIRGTMYSRYEVDTYRYLEVSETSSQSARPGRKQATATKL